jgi:hypothetical protein
VEQRVVDRHLQSAPGRQQPFGDQAGQGQTELVGAPAGAGEEVVRAVVRPQARQPRAQKHPAHRATSCLHDQACGQGREGLERRRGETRTRHLQQDKQGRKYGRERKHQRHLAKGG